MKPLLLPSPTASKCFSHIECDSYQRSDGAFCGADNICVPALGFGQGCEDSLVCPECDCSTPTICYGLHDAFFDNFDNNRVYCIGSTEFNCGHLGTFYATGATNNSRFYLPDKQNVYLCTYEWSDPICSEGYIFDIGDLTQGEIGYMSLEGLSEYCISDTPPVPEYPSPLIPIIVMMGGAGVAYTISKR